MNQSEILRQSGEKRAMLIEALDCAVMAFYHVYLCHEKVGLPQVAFTTSPEEFVNVTDHRSFLFILDLCLKKTRQRN